MSNPISNPQSSSESPKIRFTDLNIDCAILILEELDFIDLLNAANASKRIAPAAADVFKRKFSQYRIVITHNFTFPEPKPTGIISNALSQIGLAKMSPKGSVVQVPEYFELKIEDYHMIVKTFRHFGAVISKLILLNNCDPKHKQLRRIQCRFLGELISNYTSECLIQLEFDMCSEKIMNSITMPLASVESVSFGQQLNVEKSVFRMNELFPSVERLFLNHYYTEVDNFNCHMPKLKFLYIRGGYLMHTIFKNPKQSTDENMFTKNRQIQNISLYNTPPEYIETLNKLLPNLENLTLSFHWLHGAQLRFDNVTSFCMESLLSPPNILHFPKLQTFSINNKPKQLSVWQAFLREHKFLTRFHLKYVDLNDREFEIFAVELPNLVELSVWLRVGFIHVNDIVDLLAHHEKLMTFKLISDNVTNKHLIQKDLIQLEDKWHIQIVHSKSSFGFLFERKQQLI